MLITVIAVIPKVVVDGVVVEVVVVGVVVTTNVNTADPVKIFTLLFYFS